MSTVEKKPQMLMADGGEGIVDTDGRRWGALQDATAGSGDGVLHAPRAAAALQRWGKGRGCRRRGGGQRALAAWR